MASHDMRWLKILLGLAIVVVAIGTAVAGAVYLQSIPPITVDSN